MAWRKQRDDLCHFHWALFCIDLLYLANRTKIYGTAQQCPQRKGGVAQARREMTGGSISTVGRSNDGDVDYGLDYDVDDEIDGGGRS